MATFSSLVSIAPEPSLSNRSKASLMSAFWASDRSKRGPDFLRPGTAGGATLDFFVAAGGAAVCVAAGVMVDGVVAAAGAIVVEEDCVEINNRD